jgi:hypothetical protein
MEVEFNHLNHATWDGRADTLSRPSVGTKK